MPSHYLDPIRFNRIEGVESFTGGDDIDRLAASAGNDLIQTNQGLSTQLSALQDIANRRGEAGAVREAGQRASETALVDQGTLERRTRGLDLSARQKAGLKKRLGLTRAIAIADAKGATRRRFADRAEAVNRIGGGLSDAFFEQRLGAEADDAAVQAQQESAAAQRSAGKKASKRSLIGTLAGTALGIIFSSEKIKDDHGDAGPLLDKLKKVRVNRWNYKGDDQEHVGPFAEEFNNTFGINTKTPGLIHIVDALGVTMGAVKELNDKVEARGL